MHIEGGPPAAAVLLLAQGLMACAEAPPPSDPRMALGVFAGQMTDDGWETIVLTPDAITWQDSHLAGVALSRDWAMFARRLRFGIEGTVIRHRGLQDHLELDLPVYVRYRALDPLVPVQGVAFGLGLSYAFAVPAVEVDRKGDSQKILAHWFAEIEFGAPDWAASPFLRLHHRSDGYSIADFDTGSNGVVIGLRLPF